MSGETSDWVTILVVVLGLLYLANISSSLSEIAESMKKQGKPTCDVCKQRSEK